MPHYIHSSREEIIISSRGNFYALIRKFDFLRGGVFKTPFRIA